MWKLFSPSEYFWEEKAIRDFEICRGEPSGSSRILRDEAKAPPLHNDIITKRIRVLVKGLANMIKNIIFDLGGVLMTDVPLVKIARDLSVRFSRSEDKIHSYLYPNEHWTRLTLGKISENEYWDHFLKASKVKVDREELKDRVRSELRPIEKNVEILPLLKSQYKLTVLSNHSREWSEFMREEFDFFNYFDQIIISCDVGLRKPDPRIYQLTVKRLESKPEECLFIDDKKRNTEGAESCGINSIVFEDRIKLLENLPSFGVKIKGRESLVD
ncbi:MAG: hypothetical protein AMJ91_05035 [candidate division Zixibacteria bacterium SM23_73_3]|nr:MAG: hypothetical protein AMJ91_05035 [candidate division Zixibacteria bacterium SM23_73_3]